jgi:hypothetical protein
VPSAILKGYSGALDIVLGELKRRNSFIGDVDRVPNPTMLNLEGTHVDLDDFSDMSERAVSQLHAP